MERTVTVTVATAQTEQRVKPRRPATPRRSARAVSATGSCDPNITVKRATTSCPFAENVFYSYWLNEADPGVFADRPGIPAYSPARDRMFYVDCTEARTIVCRTRDGAEVRFARTAFLAYTPADAERYAATADLGDVPAFTEELAAPSPAPADDGSRGPDGGDAGCDPSYEGACLDPGAGDYDCAGGSGNGPNYTGVVTVVGDDHFGLDRDGDGIGCE